jgi:hypothetical protein
MPFLLIPTNIGVLKDTYQLLIIPAKEGNKNPGTLFKMMYLKRFFLLAQLGCMQWT